MSGKTCFLVFRLLFCVCVLTNSIHEYSNHHDLLPSTPLSEAPPPNATALLTQNLKRAGEDTHIQPIANPSTREQLLHGMEAGCSAVMWQKTVCCNTRGLEGTHHLSSHPIGPNKTKPGGKMPGSITSDLRETTRRKRYLSSAVINSVCHSDQLPWFLQSSLYLTS